MTIQKNDLKDITTYEDQIKEVKEALKSHQKSQLPQSTMPLPISPPHLEVSIEMGEASHSSTPVPPPKPTKMFNWYEEMYEKWEQKIIGSASQLYWLN